MYMKFYRWNFTVWVRKEFAEMQVDVTQWNVAGVTCYGLVIMASSPLNNGPPEFFVTMSIFLKWMGYKCIWGEKVEKS